MSIVGRLFPGRRPGKAKLKWLYSSGRSIPPKGKVFPSYAKFAGNADENSIARILEVTLRWFLVNSGGGSVNGGDICTQVPAIGTRVFVRTGR